MVSTRRGAAGTPVEVVAGVVALTPGVDVGGTGVARRDAADDPSAAEGCAELGRLNATTPAPIAPITPITPIDSAAVNRRRPGR